MLVSVADELALSDFVVPSFVHRGGLTLALHAGIVDGALSRRIGQDLERALGPDYGDFIATLSRVRERLGREVSDPEVRQSLFERVLNADLLDVIRREGLAGADARIDALLAASGPVQRRIG